MILICKELEERLDKAWSELQQTIVAWNPGISQIDVDDISVRHIERKVEDLKQEVARKRS